MPENPQKKATLVSVGDNGELVFSAQGAQFIVEVNDDLERAILEAKQIRAEQITFAQPSAKHSLPISQIQALIRAGAEPAKVAERYQLNEALVRRFSSSVQTEKQYAIEQFLAVPAPKESRVHTISELVERSLASAQIGMETVTWTATRRGLEPWRVTASFMSAGRRVRADWSWNMHDNAILSLNATAKRLMGEISRNTDQGDTPAVADEHFLSNVEIPGDSVRSARIQRAVAAWSTDADDGPSTGASSTRHAGERQRDGHRPAPEADTVTPDGRAAQAAQAEVPDDQVMPISAIARRPFSRPVSRTIMQQAVGSGNGSSSSERRAESHNGAGMPSPSQQTVDVDQASDQKPSPRTAAAPTHAGDAARESRKPSEPDKSEASGKTTKRRSGRSAVPSWDEILFGES